MTKPNLLRLLIIGWISITISSVLAFGYVIVTNRSHHTNNALRAAESGNAVAQYSVGEMYRLGERVTRDDSEAVKWYRKAAEQGHASAMYRLGFMYQLGYGVTKDRKEALKWFIKAAERGDAGAQNILGLVYAYGAGVPRNNIEAYKWITLSAEQGNFDAFKFREILKKKMRSEQLSEAQKLADEFRPKI